jgi:hypothetical protein
VALVCGVSGTLYESFTGHIVFGIDGDIRDFVNLPGITNEDEYGTAMPVASVDKNPVWTITYCPPRHRHAIWTVV